MAGAGCLESLGRGISYAVIKSGRAPPNMAGVQAAFSSLSAEGGTLVGRHGPGGVRMLASRETNRPNSTKPEEAVDPVTVAVALPMSEDELTAMQDALGEHFAVTDIRRAGPFGRGGGASVQPGRHRGRAADLSDGAGTGDRPGCRLRRRARSGGPYRRALPGSCARTAQPAWRTRCGGCRAGRPPPEPQSTWGRLWQAEP